MALLCHTEHTASTLSDGRCGWDVHKLCVSYEILVPIDGRIKCSRDMGKGYSKCG